MNRRLFLLIPLLLFPTRYGVGEYVGAKTGNRYWRGTVKRRFFRYIVDVDESNYLPTGRYTFSVREIRHWILFN